MDSCFDEEVKTAEYIAVRSEADKADGPTFFKPTLSKLQAL